MAFVTGISTIGTTVTLVTVQTLPMKGIGPEGNTFGVRLVLFSKRAARDIIMTTQACFIIRKIFLMISPKFIIKSCGMAASAGNRSVLTDFIMVAVGTFVSILISMNEMGKNNPSATVIHHDTGRIFLHCWREKKSGYCRN